jgi:soluble lytic murein transglycosylase-like protein
MTLTRKAKPLYLALVAAMAVTAGGVTRLNQMNPGAEHVVSSVYRILPAQVAQEAIVPVAKQIVASAADTVESAAKAVTTVVTSNGKRETTAQKRVRYAPVIKAAAEASNVPVALIEAVITAESQFNPNAVSPVGAVGMMQLMPKTAERFGVKDRTDPEENILGGAKYLKVLLKRFDNDQSLAIAAYNAGEGNVKKHGNKIPPFPETQKYVPKVLAYYAEYRDQAVA